MDLRRIGGYAGIAGIALFLAGFFLPGAPPAVDAKASEIAHFVADKEGTLKIAFPLMLLGVTAIGLFFLALFSRLRDEGPWAYAILLGAAPSGAMAAIGIGAGGALLLNGNLDQSGLVTIASLQAAAFTAGAAFDLLYLVALIAMGNAVPSWFRGLSGLLMILGVISIFGIGNSSLSVMGFVYFFGFVVWILGGSAWLLGAGQTAATPAPART